MEQNTPQGKTQDTVRRKLTSSPQVGGQKVSASEDEPRHVVESEQSGKEAAHRLNWGRAPLK